MPGLFDQAVWLYRRNFRLFLGIAAPVYLPVVVLTSLLTAWILPSAQGIINNFPQPGQGGSNQAYINALADFASRSTLTTIVSLIGSVLLVVAEGALAWAIGQRYMDRPVTVLGTYRAMRPHLGWLVVFIFVQSIASYLVFLPPLYLYVIIAWSFVTQVIVLENVPLITGLQRSWRLVQGQWWRTLGMNALVLIIGTVIVLPAGVISTVLFFLGFPLGLVGFVVQFASLTLSLVFLPARLAALTLMYYDLRIRKEAYDLEMAVAEHRAAAGPPLMAAQPPVAPVAAAPLTATPGPG